MTSEPPPGGPAWHHEPATEQSTRPSASSSFFRWLRGLDLPRTSDRWLGGVAGAVARRTGLDLALVRGLIVVLAVFGGIGVLLYGLAWALLPEPDGRIHVEQAGRGSWTAGLSGAVALVAVGLWRPNVPFLGDGAGGLVWTVFWVGAVALFVYWIINRSKVDPADAVGVTAGDGGGSTTAGDRSTARTDDSTAPMTAPTTAEGTTDSRAETPAPTLPYNPGDASWSYGGSRSFGNYGSYGSFPAAAPPAIPGPPTRTPRKRPLRPSGSATALLVGSATLVAGTLLALDYTRLLDVADPVVVALSSAAVVLALGIVVLGLRGRTSGVVGFIAALTTAAALVTSLTGTNGSFIVAQQVTQSPTSLRAAGSGYSVLAAEATVDLTGLPAPQADTVIPVNALASDVTVIVREDVPVEVRTRMALGSADALGTATAIDGPAPAFDDDGGVLQLTTRDLNPEASGPSLVLDVRGALSDVSILTAPARGTSPSDPTPPGGQP